MRDGHKLRNEPKIQMKRASLQAHKTMIRQIACFMESQQTDPWVIRVV